MVPSGVCIWLYSDLTDSIEFYEILKRVRIGVFVFLVNNWSGFEVLC